MRALKLIYIFQKNHGKPQYSILAEIEIHAAFLDSIHNHNAMTFDAGKHRLRMAAGLRIGTFITDGTGI